MIRTLFAVALLVALPGVSEASVARTGAFALLNGTQQVTATLNEEVTAGAAHLTIVEFNRATHAALHDYDADMTKPMHLIVVRDDLETFVHVHPAFNATTGTFTARVPIEAGHRYYAYADTHPHGFDQQVFRFTLNAGAHSSRRPAFIASARTSNAGPYTVNVERTEVAAAKALALRLHIARGGRDAKGLRPYLGAPAHVVFISTRTLAYAHVHPMRAGDTMHMGESTMTLPATAGPHLMLHVPALQPGAYRMWVQFATANGAVQTASFTIVAR